MDKRKARFAKALTGAGGLLLAATAGAQQVDPGALRPAGGLGLQPAAVEVSVGCGASLLPCSDDAQRLAAREPGGLRWSVELAPVQLSPGARAAALGTPRQGLNLSLLGRKPIFGSSFSIYGRLGATYSAAETLAASSPPGEGGHGLSFGAGVSYDFSPRLSATFGVDSYDLRGGTGPRENLRSTSLGLRYRY